MCSLRRFPIAHFKPSQPLIHIWPTSGLDQIYIQYVNLNCRSISNRSSTNLPVQIGPSSRVLNPFNINSSSADDDSLRDTHSDLTTPPAALHPSYTTIRHSHAISRDHSPVQGPTSHHNIPRRAPRSHPSQIWNLAELHYKSSPSFPNSLSNYA